VLVTMRAMLDAVTTTPARSSTGRPRAAPILALTATRRRSVEQFAPAFILRVAGIFDLQPSDARAIPILQALGDNAFEGLRATAFAVIATSWRLITILPKDWQPSAAVEEAAR